MPELTDEMVAAENDQMMLIHTLAMAKVPEHYRLRALIREPLEWQRDIYMKAHNFCHGIFRDENEGADERQPHTAFIITGMGRCGKTHLLCAMLRLLAALNVSIRFMNMGEWVMRIRDNISNGFPLMMDIDDLIKPRVLGIDDLFSAKITDFVAEAFYVLVNGRLNKGRGFIITSDVDLSKPPTSCWDDRMIRIVNRIREIAGGKQHLMPIMK